MTGDFDYHVVLDQGAAPFLYLRDPNHLLAVSADGVSWKKVRSSTLPRKLGSQRVAWFRDRFVVVGIGRQAAVSRTGRSWTVNRLSSACGRPSDLVVSDAIQTARKGILAVGDRSDGYTAADITWCWSPDGRRWHALEGWGPLPAEGGNDECATGCPGGILQGDGTRFLALRTVGAPAAWTSADGRHWRRLRFSRALPRLDDSARVTLLPHGILVHTGGRVWYGNATR
jgi:hypothetical protein